MKEKVLAAHRAGLKQVILPKKNGKDLHEVPENVKVSNRLLQVSVMYIQKILIVHSNGGK